MSLIILPSVCSIDHKGPVKHVADGDDDKPALRNYAKGGVRFDLISKREPINRTAVSSAFPVAEAAL